MNCKSNGGIKAIYLTEAGDFTLVDTKLISVTDTLAGKEYKHTANFKILSPSMKKMVKWMDQEIKDCERSAEEYFQELDNPEEGNQQLAKVEALKSVKKYIQEKI